MDPEAIFGVVLRKQCRTLHGVQLYKNLIEVAPQEFRRCCVHKLDLHFFSAFGVHHTFIPPSTTISTAVTYELSSEARNTATFVTSSARPSRPNRVLPTIEPLLPDPSP